MEKTYSVGYKTTAKNNQVLIMAKLQEAGGVLNLSDKSTPEEVKDALGISKKKFKEAIGNLYKQRTIKIENNRIIKI